MTLNRFAIVTLAILSVGLFAGPADAIESASRSDALASEGAGPVSFPKRMSASEAKDLMATLDLKLGQIDRSQFNLEALLEKLSYDESEVIQFVREHIAFEDYNGLLRGAEGTLGSRAGNSLDQALLLAKLLKDVGLDARIVQGEVPREVMIKLALQKRMPPPGIFLPSGSATVKKDAGTAQSVFTTPPQVAEISARLSKSLQEQGIALASDQAADGQDKVAYFWVEYREASSSPWVAVHPAVSSESAQVPDVKPIKYFAEAIDETLQQRISVQAFIERSWAGKTETLAVSARHEYPTANLSGATFKYSVLANVDFAQAQADGQSAAETLSKATLFFPVFDFGSPAPGKAFDNFGNTLSAEDAASDKAALFQTIGGKFGEVAGALMIGEDGGSKSAKPLRYVTRHWLEFTIKQPGHESRIITRDLAVWNGDEAQFKQSLARAVYFRVETGAVAPAQFLERYLLGLKKSVQIEMSQAVSRKDLDDKALQFSQDAEVFLLTSDIIAQQQQGEISYRGAPAIVARYSPFGRVDVVREGFDIISSPRTVLSASNGQPVPGGAVASGVMDTWLEYKLFVSEEWLQDSAFKRLGQTMQASKRLTLLSHSSPAALDQIPELGRNIIERDIANQSLVVYPGEPSSCDSWWRVDPITGETIGMLDNGWGGVSEYIADLTLIFGKVKVGAAMLSCSTVIALLKGSAALSAYSIFASNDRLGDAGWDLCSQLPSPGLQTLCSAVLVGAAAAGESAAAGLSAETLQVICLRIIF